MKTARVCFVALSSAAAAAALTAGQETVRPRTPTAAQEWRTYGHDPGGMRFSPVAQITPANVGQLSVAWVYHMRPPAAAAPPPADAAPPAPGRGRGRGRGGSGFSPGETTPLVIDGVMYVSTPYGRVVALDSATGKEVWVFQLPSGTAFDTRCRVLARRCGAAAADRVRLERREAVLSRCQDRQDS